MVESRDAGCAQQVPLVSLLGRGAYYLHGHTYIERNTCFYVDRFP